MSEIAISEKLRPFSHLPGTLCLIPGSHYAVQVYPCLLRLYNFELPKPVVIKEIKMLIKGPVDNFTLQCDLEKGCLRVWGTGAGGFFRYEIKKYIENEIALYLEKSIAGPIQLSEGEDSYFLEARQIANLLNLKAEISSSEQGPPLLERFSLGNHKAQDWDLIIRRMDLTEIYPCLYRLAQWVTPLIKVDEGLAKHLHAVEGSLTKPEAAVQAWKKIILALFQGILTPYWEDELHQGIIDPAFFPPMLSPLYLLKECMRTIRLQFFEQNEFYLHILPALPPEFHCGRFNDLHVPQKGMLDFEWTKKIIRRVVFRSEKDQEIIFQFKKVKSFRFRKGKLDPGVRINSGQSLTFEKNCYYFFDNFH
ncbi:MAG: hypothetical protein H0V82_00850 [Candidatus Protochlamydia sp.]|nr:hypothetical protein [Candidatus Protochlamydia sp.]